ncbi:MAG: response regulator [Proteobacteria bacterium]|nr:response regulator [Pseudomonadota bacterium]
MQIFIVEQIKKDSELREKNIRGWGYEPVSTKETTLSGLPVASKIVLLGKLKSNRIKIIENLRSNAFYTYIICLQRSETTDEIGALFEAGADDVIEFGELDNLRYKIQCGQRILETGVLHKRSVADMGIEKSTQAINLSKMNVSFNKEIALSKKLLKSLIVTGKQFQVTRESLQSDQLDEFYKKSIRLGTDTLSDWLCGILTTKSQPQLLEIFNFNLLQVQFNQIIKEVEANYQILLKYEYFQSLENAKNKTPLKDAKILLVEDLQYNRALVRQILKKHDCDISEAENGVEAVKSWEKETDFDLIIMDMNMPVMDGFAATEEIRKIEATKNIVKTPVLALTALAMRGDEERCLSVGCDGYIAKPVNAKTLIKACEDLILKRSMKESQSRKHLPSLNIRNSLLKTKNQVHAYSLVKAFSKLGIELICLESTADLMNQLVAKDFDLIILDGDDDLHLAYEIKDHFPRQQMMLVCSNTSRFFTNQSGQKSESILAFPFSQKEVAKILQHMSLNLQQNQKNQDMMADVSSLKQVKSQLSIEECVQQSDSQLAVWQKAFRKIGGDLVLSHVFDFHGKFGFVLADVAGHDIVSGYTASWFSGLVKGTWGHYSQPLDLLLYLNSLFAHEGNEEGKRFVCALVLLWDRQRCELHYANAGIPGGILVKSQSGDVETINWKGIPIGMFPDIEMFDNGTIDFQPGDRLYMATDGILEAIPSEIIANLGVEQQKQKPPESLASIVDFVTRSIDIQDDLTISLFEARPLPKPIKGFRRSIPSNFEAVDSIIAEMQDFVENQISSSFDWGMISVAAREALINAVEHGNQKKENQPIDVDIEWLEPALEIRVSDSGSGFDLVGVKKRLRAEGDLRIQGRGIEIIENVAHQVSFQGSGIKMEFLPNEPST